MAGFRTISGSGYGNIYVDSLIWGGQIWDMSTGPITVKFGGDGMYEWRDQVVGKTPHVLETPFPTVDIADYLNRYDWFFGPQGGTDADVMVYVADLYSSVANIEFADATNYADANLVWWKVGLPNGYLTFHEMPDEYKTSGPQRWGYFDSEKTDAWKHTGFGGVALNEMIRAVGYAVGLAPPHNGGLRSDKSAFPGSEGGAIGLHGLNQGVYTVMSPNAGYNGTPAAGNFGSQGGLGAFDIAALQKMYGANTTTAPGDDVYNLAWYNGNGTGWAAIWDTGGIDTIKAHPYSQSVTIDLRAATLLANDPGAGGYLSHASEVAGGFTIANGVVIENAIGADGNDILIGNSAANTLNGGLGNDTYYIDGANDIIVDAGGNDTVYANFNYSNPNIENIYVNGVLIQSGGKPVTVGGTPVNSDFTVSKGTSAKNTLLGTDGNDKMYGYAGNDTLVGSKGIDIFVFNTRLNAKTNKDAVKAFVTKEDKVWLDNAIFRKLGKGTESKPEKLKKSFFKIGSQAGDADDFIILNKKTGVASYDLDGNGSGKAVAFAVFDKKALPSLADFFVV